MTSPASPSPRRFRTLNTKNFHLRQSELFQPNHIDACRPMDGYMYETFAAEDAYVREIAQKFPDRVATIVSVDSGAWYICRGWHYVNRIGYLIAKEGVSLPEFTDFRY